MYVIINILMSRLTVGLIELANAQNFRAIEALYSVKWQFKSGPYYVTETFVN